MRDARHRNLFCLLSNDVDVGRQNDPSRRARTNHVPSGVFGYLTCSKTCISHAAVPLPPDCPRFFTDWLSPQDIGSEFSWWIRVALQGRATFRNR
jgi:hypothetical protein